MPLIHQGNLQSDSTALSTLAYQVGRGQVSCTGEIIRLTLGKNEGITYSDAQLDDYHKDGVMKWRAPLQMTMQARFSHPEAMLRGTAGFGFWNDPFGMTKGARHVPWLPNLHLPQAVWFFFASSPSDMALAMGVAGHGWKAATIDASRPLAKFLLPIAPLGMLACRVPWGYQRVWPLAQRVLKIDEATVPATLTEWHEYVLTWEPDGVRFVVDGAELMRSKYSPHGPLGFVAWIDNQYMIATPQGRIAHGVVGNDEQWLEIAGLEVTPR